MIKNIIKANILSLLMYLLMKTFLCSFQKQTLIELITTLHAALMNPNEGQEIHKIQTCFFL